MSFKEKTFKIISLKEPSEEEGIQEEINTTMPFTSFTHLAYATLINQKKKSQMYKRKKIETVDTGLTNISYFHVQLCKFRNAILYVCTKVVYTQVCT